MDTALDSLMRLAKAYADLANVSLKTVSWRVFGDSKKLSAIERGADLQTRRLEAAVGWLDENWPEGGDWPSDIVRPSSRRRGAA